MEWDPAQRSAQQNYFFLTSAVAPRPIAWVSTIDPDSGVVNVAPFSWFQAVCAEPPTLMLAIADRPGGTAKDTLRNIQASGEFVVNAAPAGLVDAIVATSADQPAHVSEAEVVGLELAPSARVSPPRVADSPIHLECRLVSTQRIGADGGSPTTLVLGEVVHVAADDAVLDERGNVDPRKVVWLARLGGSDYCAVEEVFVHRRPRQDDPLRK